MVFREMIPAKNTPIHLPDEKNRKILFLNRIVYTHFFFFFFVVRPTFMTCLQQNIPTVIRVGVPGMPKKKIP